MKDRLPLTAAPHEFIYQPLKGAEIRCVVLRPYDESVGTIECELWQGDLGSQPFHTLSYSWGDPTAVETIRVSGHPFEVTSSLASCLRRIAAHRLARQTATGDILLWIDAICINQRDILERNAQVLRIQHIYKAAELVIIWLGPQGEYTGLVVDYLQRIERDVGSGPMLLLRDTAERERFARTHVEEPGLFLDDKLQQGVKDFYQRDWWKRTWILQEIVMAKASTFLCGEYELTDDQVFGFVALMTSYFMDHPDEGLGLSSIEIWLASNHASIIWGLVQSAKYGFKFGLYRLLQNSVISDATDPRDKIYGILGLSSDFCSGEIKIDYQISIRDVFMNTVRTHFDKHRNLEILDRCTFGEGRDLELPSWVPDCRARDVRNVVSFVDDAKLYNAAGEYSFASHEPRIEENILRVHGRCFDTIETVLDTCDWASGSMTVQGMVDSWSPAPSVLPETYKSTGETVEAAFRRTLVADMRMLWQPTRGYSAMFKNDPGSSDPDPVATNLTRYNAAFMSCVAAWPMKRFAWTAGGLMGLVRNETQVGDQVAFIAGAPRLEVLREVEGGNKVEMAELDPALRQFNLIGEAYFHGMMDGEATIGRMVEPFILV